MNKHLKRRQNRRDKTGTEASQPVGRPQTVDKLNVRKWNMCYMKWPQTHSKEEPLWGAGFEEFLPLPRVVFWETEGINLIGDLTQYVLRPLRQLQQTGQQVKTGQRRRCIYLYSETRKQHLSPLCVIFSPSSLQTPSSTVLGEEC